MQNYSSHSKFIFCTYDAIQDAINNKIIDANDIVICDDTKELILIRDDFSFLSIKSKVYRYPDVETAENSLNANLDTYEGQLISILSDAGAYEAYIVNRNLKGRFYITPLNASSGTIDYDTLSHRPIINLYGEISDPVILDQQNDGFYAVNGNYKISNNLETIFSSASNNFFLVSHKEDGSIKIKKISTDEIIDYTVINNTVNESIVPTTDWLDERGYASKEYVDKKIEALEIVSKDDLETYVTQLVNETLDTTIDNKIDEKINEKIITATDKEIVDIFNSQ